MVALVKFERRVIDTSILRIIVGKFSNREKSCLVILPLIDESSEVDLHNIILSLGLAIDLRMKDC